MMILTCVGVGNKYEVNVFITNLYFNRHYASGGRKASQAGF